MKLLRKITVLMLAAALVLVPFALLWHPVADTGDVRQEGGTVLYEKTGETTAPENLAREDVDTFVGLAGTSFTVESVYVIGVPGGGFIKGATMDPKEEGNHMKRISPCLYTITYDGCESGADAYFRFALNGGWEDGFGAGGEVTMVANQWIAAAYNGGTYKLPSFEGKADVTVMLDLTNYNHTTTQGAQCIVYISPVATPTPVSEVNDPTPTPMSIINDPPATPTPVSEVNDPTPTPMSIINDPPATPIPTIVINDPTPTPMSIINDPPITPTPTPTPKPEVQKITLNRSTLKMPSGRGFRLKATFIPEGTSPNLTWWSGNTNVVTVSQKGYVVARKPGTTLVTATASNGVHAVCKITVYTRQVRQFTKNGVYRYSTSSVTQKELLGKGYLQSNAFKALGHSNTPVYWITTPGTGKHHLTTDYYEAYAARYRGDKAGRAFFSSDTPTSKPVFELVQMTKVRNYRYTTDVKMKNYLVSIGWVCKGVAFYAAES